MKLKSGIHIKVSYVVLGVLAVVLAGFFLRVMIWEGGYYAGQEGKTRAVPEVSATDETTALIEVAPSEEEVRNYNVPDGYPRYLNIESLGIKDARILNASLTDSGALATPVNIYDAAWYNNSGLPGAGGTVVINGHNGANQKGIFKELSRLEVGAVVNVEVGGGAVYSYKVVENVAVPLADADEYMRVAFSSPMRGVESLTLISCSGKWIYAQNTYDHRQFVRAVRF